MNELVIVKADTLPVEQRNYIDTQIGQLIQQHKNNRGEINRLTFECVTSLAAGQSRSVALSSQGFFSRLFGSLTGKNQRLQAEIDRNFAAAQYASQMCLQKLAENNLMTFELVAAVNNKLNSFAVNFSTEFNNVNREINNIRKFFNQVRHDILQLEQRVDRLERNVKLLNWQASIEYQIYDGVEYESLSTIGKIICLSKDFYKNTQGKISDLSLFKSALNKLNLPPKSKITYLEFLNGLIDEPIFLRELLSEINLDDIDSVYTTLLEIVKKYQLLESTEKYQIDSIRDMMTAQGVNVPQKEITTNMVAKYIFNVSGVSLNTEISIFDFCLELICNIDQAKYNHNKKQEAQDYLDKLMKNFDPQTQEINNLRMQINQQNSTINNLNYELDALIKSIPNKNFYINELAKLANLYQFSNLTLANAYYDLYSRFSRWNK